MCPPLRHHTHTLNLKLEIQFALVYSFVPSYKISRSRGILATLNQDFDLSGRKIERSREIKVHKEWLIALGH